MKYHVTFIPQLINSIDRCPSIMIPIFELQGLIISQVTCILEPRNDIHPVEVLFHIDLLHRRYNDLLQTTFASFLGRLIVTAILQVSNGTNRRVLAYRRQSFGACNGPKSHYFYSLSGRSEHTKLFISKFHTNASLDIASFERNNVVFPYDRSCITLWRQRCSHKEVRQSLDENPQRCLRKAVWQREGTRADELRSAKVTYCRFGNGICGWRGPGGY